MSRMRRAARLGVVAVVTAFVVVALAGPALAHAALEKTSPARGVTVDSSPKRVALSFSEPVSVERGRVHVFDDQLHRVDEGEPHRPRGQADTVVVSLRDHLGRGTYTVSWRVISADSHPVSGSFHFSVGARSDVAGTIPDAGGNRTVTVLLGAVRFGGYAGLALGLGSLAVLIALWPSGRLERRPRRLVTLGFALLAVNGVAGFLLEGPYAVGRGLPAIVSGNLLADTVGSPAGQAYLCRLALLAALALLLPALLRPRPLSERPPTWAMAGGGVLAAAIAFTFGLVGHASTGPQVPAALASNLIHVTAMSVWIGGLVLLITCLTARARADTLAGVLPRFSRTAFTCVAVIVATGAYQTWRDVGTFGGFPHTLYGRLLMAKIAGVVVLVALGNQARRWVRRRYTAPPRHPAIPQVDPGETETADDGTRPPSDQPDRLAIRALRRGLYGEVTLGVVVLALTTVLVNTPWARDAYSPAYSKTVATSVATVRVVVDPPQPGKATVRVRTTGDDGSAKSVRKVTGDLTLPKRGLGPLPLRFHQAGPGKAVAHARFPAGGSWVLKLTVQTSPVRATTLSVPVSVR